MAPPPRVRALTRESVPGAPAWMEPLFTLLNEGLGQPAQALNRNLTFSENFAAQLRDISFTAPYPVWTNVTFAAGASSFSATTSVQYRIDERGEVELQGLGTGIAAVGIYFTLPTGFRALRNKAFASVSNNAFARVNALTSGAIQLEVGSAVWVSFDGIRFPATNPALPTVTPDAFPLLKHDLPDVAGVLPVYCQAVGARPNQASGAPVVDWERASNKSIRLKAIHGLTPGQKYQMRLLLFVR